VGYQQAQLVPGPVARVLRRVTVDRNEDSLELQIEPKAELGRLFRLTRHTGATGVEHASGGIRILQPAETMQAPDWSSLCAGIDPNPIQRDQNVTGMAWFVQMIMSPRDLEKGPKGLGNPWGLTVLASLSSSECHRTQSTYHCPRGT
jgi:hypothetical protein